MEGGLPLPAVTEPFAVLRPELLQEPRTAFGERIQVRPRLRGRWSPPPAAATRCWPTPRELRASRDRRHPADAGWSAPPLGHLRAEEAGGRSENASAMVGGVDPVDAPSRPGRSRRRSRGRPTDRSRAAVDRSAIGDPRFLQVMHGQRRGSPGRPGRCSSTRKGDSLDRAVRHLKETEDLLKQHRSTAATDRSVEHPRLRRPVPARFQALEDAIHDHRVDDLAYIIDAIFNLYARLLREGAARGQSAGDAGADRGTPASWPRVVGPLRDHHRRRGAAGPGRRSQ